MIATQQNFGANGRWHRYGSTILVLFIVLAITFVAIFIFLKPVFAFAWRSYPLLFLPEQAYQRNVLWQVSQAEHPSLAAALAALPLQQQSGHESAALRIFLIPAYYEPHFCTGDQVLLKHGAQHYPGILRLKIAAGDAQATAQLGIAFTELQWQQLQALDGEILDNTALRLQRISYLAGDWLRVNCQFLQQQQPKDERHQ